MYIHLTSNTLLKSGVHPQRRDVSEWETNGQNPNGTMQVLIIDIHISLHLISIHVLL